ncbi:energy transducer TonB [Chryseobacterium phocaeense]|uniref:energy transducer TonB n=1 Tax=Chryseobacterium phocaeense TaxID=1816690 RepID=UPI001E65C8E6|nr:energy transducer TonB [Chryseobacterium phocaeense]
MKALFFFLFCFVCSFCFSQQKEEFRQVKTYYNQHRNMLNTEFKKKFDAEPNLVKKTMIKNDFLFFMKKMDSIENVAMIGALLKVRNLEDLQFLKKNENNPTLLPLSTSILEKPAEYPGGMNALRKEVAGLFYTGGVYTETKTARANVVFMIEKDGSISNVQAEGDNFTFNRQAEIAIYSITDKFSPAIAKGDAVRSRFRLPLTLNIEN